MAEIERELKVSELPALAFDLISEEQQSYLDEFRFWLMSDGTIQAWYAGEWLTTWNGLQWNSEHHLWDGIT